MTLSVELSGLQAAQADLDTIGNNIANVGTDGFKSSTVNFADLYGNSLLGSAGTAGTPGQGVTTSSISQLFTEGTINTTGDPLNVAINGNGFFQVLTGSGTAYSRDGSFQLDANGNLVNSSGAFVMGFSAPASGATSVAAGALTKIQISEASIPPVATNSLALDVNLPSTDTPINTTVSPFNVNQASSYNESTTSTVYDSLGVPRTLTTYFTEVSGSGAPAQWQTHWALSNTNGSMVASGSGATLTFNSSGVLTAGTGTINVANMPNGAAPLSITQSFSGTVLSDLTFGVNSIQSNGTAAGQFAGLDIGSNGNVVAQYSNGATQTMGTIALVNFTNPQGLVPVTGNNWLPSATSGQPQTNTPGSAGVGVLESGALEGSNVDLSTQLVNLIVAQQAYQANVQSINVDQQDVQKLMTIQ
jgi:flagellar hook protein FlgE